MNVCIWSAVLTEILERMVVVCKWQLVHLVSIAGTWGDNLNANYNITLHLGGITELGLELLAWTELHIHWDLVCNMRPDLCGVFCFCFWRQIDVGSGPHSSTYIFAIFLKLYFSLWKMRLIWESLLGCLQSVFLMQERV